MTAAPAAVATSIFPVILLVAVSGASLLQLARAVPPPDHAAQGATLSVHQGQVRTIFFFFETKMHTIPRLYVVANSSALFVTRVTRICSLELIICG
jgi:hypothetical protein